MKNTLVKTLVLTGLTLSPAALFAQGKGTDLIPAPTAQPEPGGKLGNNNDEKRRGDNSRDNQALFDSLDLDKNGALTREEFGQLGPQRRDGDRQNRNRDNKDRPNANRDRTNNESNKNGDAKNNTDGARDEATSGSRSDATRNTTTPATGIAPANATGTTGTTGATGSSASSGAASGSNNTGTGNRPQ